MGRQIQILFPKNTRQESRQGSNPNRKQLSELAIHDKEAFGEVAILAKKALSA